MPEGALAAELTIISADATAPGFLRAYPFGGSPTATILAYQNGPNLLNTGTVALCEGTCASDLSVKSFQASTQVIIDVNGYYMPNRFASVDGTGALVSGARVEDTNRVSEGLYSVTFDSDLTGCAAIATGQRHHQPGRHLGPCVDRRSDRGRGRHREPGEPERAAGQRVLPARGLLVPTSGPGRAQCAAGTGWGPVASSGFQIERITRTGSSTTAEDSSHTIVRRCSGS